MNEPALGFECDYKLLGNGLHFHVMKRYGVWWLDVMDESNPAPIIATNDDLPSAVEELISKVGDDVGIGIWNWFVEKR